MNIIVTGGAGFIGSNFVFYMLERHPEDRIICVDSLTYAGNLSTLESVMGNPQFRFVKLDIRDREGIDRLFAEEKPEIVVNFAAESHVDRSIDGPGEFVRTNVVGTATHRQSALAWWRKNPEFVFQHISTDEVYGSLGATGAFTESTPYSPHSPYSASKAASDHLVRAWHDTYGLPTRITNCSNNYGPYHFPEKLIPLVILNCLDGKPLPVYGKGANVRDWLYVEDHVSALCLVNEKGVDGETYNVGGRNERTNLEVVQTICATLDELRPRAAGSYSDLITYVADRPGHDLRYAIDPSKLMGSLGWRPEESFDTGIRKTVQWYLENDWWWRPIREKRYAGQRLGSKA